MTTITAHRVVSSRAARTTAFDRALLQAASALDAFVATRLERRADAARRRSVAVQDAAAGARSAAEARAAIGVLPR
ncbi:MAG: hypothetical protein ACTHNQ_19595 [Microbacterium sp.]|uniref:hypothetical protein n=1 Tax=Microbacterium sp. TaxID=51671 RepID=UPI003F80CB48